MGAKIVFFEGSAHIPLIIRSPFGWWEIHPYSGKKCHAIVTLADVLPTILGIAGIEPLQGIDEVNLLDLIDKPNYNRVFFRNWENRYFAVIEGVINTCGLPGDELLQPMCYTNIIK